MPTVKAGMLDAAIDVRGPSENKRYTLVAALHVKGGGDIDRAFREVVEKAPEKDRGKVTLDADKAEGVSIHRFDKMADDLDAEGRRDFGTNPGYLAVRDDAVFFALGADGLKALKEALATKPKAGPIIRVEMALSRIPALLQGPRQRTPPRRRGKPSRARTRMPTRSI